MDHRCWRWKSLSAADKPREQALECSTGARTADSVDLLGPLALLLSRLHDDTMFSGHVVLHRCHTSSCISIVLASHRHPIVLANMWLFSEELLVSPILTEMGRIPAVILLTPSVHVLWHRLQCFFCVQTPKTHQDTCDQICRDHHQQYFRPLGQDYYHHDDRGCPKPSCPETVWNQALQAGVLADLDRTGSVEILCTS